MTLFARSRTSAGALAPVTLAIAVVVAASATPVVAGCPPEPPSLCRELGRTKFVIDSYGHVDWRASHGPATTLADFGDPDTTSHYFLCAWDGHGLLVAADIPPGAECPGGSCWSTRGSSDLSFRDLRGNNSDLRALGLSSGRRGRTRIHAETLVIGGINLPVTGDLLVQLSRDDSAVCFESAVPADAFTLNSNSEARAKTSVERRRRKGNSR